MHFLTNDLKWLYWTFYGVWKGSFIIFVCREPTAEDDQFNDNAASPPPSLRRRHCRFLSESDDSSVSATVTEVCNDLILQSAIYVWNIYEISRLKTWDLACFFWMHLLVRNIISQVSCMACLIHCSHLHEVNLSYSFFFSFWFLPYLTANTMFLSSVPHGHVCVSTYDVRFLQIHEQPQYLSVTLNCIHTE